VAGAVSIEATPDNFAGQSARYAPPRRKGLRNAKKCLETEKEVEDAPRGRETF
jgi:hypothetical protein